MGGGTDARPPRDSCQTALRIPRAWLAKADELAVFLSRPGFEASRSDALRAALAMGFQMYDFERVGMPSEKSEAQWQVVSHRRRKNRSAPVDLTRARV